MNPHSTTRKRLVMRKVLELCRALRSRDADQKYHVTRGAVNWANHDFGALPRALSVHCDDASFLRGEGNDEATISLEIMTRMPADTTQIDDDILDELTDDAAEVFEKLDSATLERTDEDDELDQYDDEEPVVVRLDRTRDSAIEVADVSRGVQGIVATTYVTF